jgi:hypothetical protein
MLRSARLQGHMLKQDVSLCLFSETAMILLLPHHTIRRVPERRLLKILLSPLFLPPTLRPRFPMPRRPV